MPEAIAEHVGEHARRHGRRAAGRARSGAGSSSSPGRGRSAGSCERLRAGAYAPAAAAAARVRPYMIEPSLVDPRAVPDRLGRDARGDPDVQDRAHPRVAVTPRTGSRRRNAGTIESTLAAAWDIIADQAPIEVVLRFGPAVAARVEETTWHPTQRVDVAADGSLDWRATVAGTIEVRLWILSWGDDVEVLAPPGLRDDVAATHRRAAGRYAEVEDRETAGRLPGGARATRVRRADDGIDADQ